MNKILLYITVFLLQAYLIRFEIFSYPSNLQEILIGGLSLTFLFTIIKEKRVISTIKNIKKHWIILILLLLTAISINSVPIFDNLTFLRQTKFIFFATILVFIFIETLRTEKERKKGLQIMGYGAITFGIFSIIYNLLGHNVAYDLRLLGPLDAAVYLGYYFTPFFLFFGMEALRHKKKWDIISAIALGLLIIATRSMGAIGGSFVVLTLFLLIKSQLNFFNKTLNKVLLAIIAIIVVGAIFYTKILPTLQTEWSSLDERGEIWQVSAHLLKDPQTLIWGAGYGQFEYHYIQNADTVLDHPPLDYFVIQPHNIFLLFIFNYGILGLVFLCFLMFKTTSQVFSKSKKLDLKAEMAFVLIYFFIHGMIDTPYFKNDLLFLLILFLELGIPKSLKATN